MCEHGEGTGDLVIWKHYPCTNKLLDLGASLLIKLANIPRNQWSESTFEETFHWLHLDADSLSPALDRGQ